MDLVQPAKLEQKIQQNINENQKFYIGVGVGLALAFIFRPTLVSKL